MFRKGLAAEGPIAKGPVDKVFPLQGQRRLNYRAVPLVNIVVIVEVDWFKHNIVQQALDGVDLHRRALFDRHAIAQQLEGLGEIEENLVVPFAVIGEDAAMLAKRGHIRRSILAGTPGHGPHAPRIERQQLGGPVEQAAVLLHAPEQRHFHHALGQRDVKKTDPPVVKVAVVAIGRCVDARVHLPARTSACRCRSERNRD